MQAIAELEQASTSELIETVHAVLGVLAARPAPDSGPAAIELSERLATAMDLGESALATFVGAADRAGEPAALRYAGTRGWLKVALGMRTGRADERLTLARQLTRIPRTASLLQAGKLAYGYASTICDAVAPLGEDDCAKAEEILLAAIAEGLSATKVAKLGLRIKDVIKERDGRDAPPEDAQRGTRSWWRVSRSLNGGGAVRGWFDPELLALVNERLGPLTKPAGPEDPRDHAQRMADSLRSYLDGGGTAWNATLVIKLADQPTPQPAPPTSAGPPRPATASSSPMSPDPSPPVSPQTCSSAGAEVSPLPQVPCAPAEVRFSTPHQSRPAPTGPNGRDPACARNTCGRTDGAGGGHGAGDAADCLESCCGDGRCDGLHGAAGCEGAGCGSGDGAADCESGGCADGAAGRDGVDGGASCGAVGCDDASCDDAGCDGAHGTAGREGAGRGGGAREGAGVGWPLVGAQVSARLADGTPMEPWQARLIAFNAGVSALVLGSDGIPLYLGRRTRFVTAAQRRVLEALYETCACDECDVPVRLCQLDHVNNWVDDGTTDIDLIAPACSFHNRLKYQQPDWMTVTRDQEGRWRYRIRRPRPSWARKGRVQPRGP